jgi:hypothetical protein
MEEAAPFLRPTDDAPSREGSTARRTLKVAAGLLLATTAVVAAAALLAGPPSSSSSSSGKDGAMEMGALSTQALSATTAAFVAELTTSNEYGLSTAGKDYPWLANKYVVEPFKYTTLEVKYDTKVYGNKLSFNWKITPPSSATSAAAPSTFSGSSIRSTFTALGSHAVEIIAFAEDGTKVGTHATTAHSVYVKREVRTLSEEDRENFLDAMHTIWSTGTKVGRTLYGDDFTGMDRFVSVHASQATGDIKCDKWHEGSGFLTHHLALSTSFEMALRAIDKRVTTPYWDFTIEGETLMKAGLGPKSVTTVSSMFTDSWFGSTDDLSHVIDSRWAHTAATLQVKAGGVKNSYGLIRAPWNNVKDKELTRHMSDVCGLEPVNKPIPTCATHFKVMNATGLPTFLTSIAGYGHGPMHVNLGGVYGACTGAMTTLYEKYSDDMSQVLTMKDIADKVEEKTGVNPGWHTTTEFTFKMLIEKYIHLEYFHIYRSLWRSQTCAADGLSAALTCPDSCGDDTPESECVCTCAGIDASTDNANFDWENLEGCLYAQDTPKTIVQTLASEEMRKDMVTMFCSAGVKEGEMLESASPSDPMFWMIHPILDRMLVAKRLAATANLKFGSFGRYEAFTDESWLDYSAYTSDTYTCEGHSMYDAVLEDLPLPAHLISAGDTNGDGELSNVEFYEVMDPTSGDAATYIYDNFDWSHCGADDVFGDSSSSSSSTTADGDASTDAAMTFEGGVNPTTWDGEDYDQMKPNGVTANPSTLVEHRAAVAAGGKPGKSLTKEARRPGAKGDYDAIVAQLNENLNSA